MTPEQAEAKFDALHDEGKLLYQREMDAEIEREIKSALVGLVKAVLKMNEWRHVPPEVVQAVVQADRAAQIFDVRTYRMLEDSRKQHPFYWASLEKPRQEQDKEKA